MGRYQHLWMKLRITVSGILSFIVADILKSCHYADKELSLPKSRIALLGLQVPNIAEMSLEIVAGDSHWGLSQEIVAGDRRWKSSLESSREIIIRDWCWRM